MFSNLKKIEMNISIISQVIYNNNTKMKFHNLFSLIANSNFTYDYKQCLYEFVRDVIAYKRRNGIYDDCDIEYMFNNREDIIKGLSDYKDVIVDRNVNAIAKLAANVDDKYFKFSYANLNYDYENEECSQEESSSEDEESVQERKESKNINQQILDKIAIFLEILKREDGLYDFNFNFVLENKRVYVKVTSQ
jgi:hypothetical protein